MFLSEYGIPIYNQWIGALLMAAYLISLLFVIVTALWIGTRLTRYYYAKDLRDEIQSKQLQEETESKRRLHNE
jgi:hypothetical protein